MTAFRTATELVREAIAARAFPAASVEVGRADRPLWSAAFGTLTYEPDAPAASLQTIFDLASLTKVIATTTLVMRAADRRDLEIESPVSAWFDRWRGVDREMVSLRDLLAHSSGLTAYLPYFRDHSGRAEFEHAICTTPLEYPPRSQAIYSDLGFMLLGFILEDACRARQRDRRGDSRSLRLSGQFQQIVEPLTREPLTFNPPRAWRSATAPTEIDPWRGRLLAGEVHDENAWALGGAAGHSGLFGTAAAVGVFARAVLRTIAGEPVLARPETMREFIRRTSVPGSSRALGWDTMVPTSSCGTLLSPTAIGHTGFTGTSLWIDWERDLYMVLLTNRVYPTRENQTIRQFRPRFHDAVVQELPGL